SAQLLLHHVQGGRLLRIRRSVYRVVHFPAGEHEDLVAVWLWSERAGVFSHQTALSLEGLSDALPAKAHLTLPEKWEGRRFRVPDGVVLHYADVPKSDRRWFGAVPVTTPARSLNDCARDGFSPELLQQGTRQAIERGLVKKSELRDVRKALAPYGGFAAQDVNVDALARRRRRDSNPW
ncbi:MAG TPA: hypothetical protein VGL13_03575, partial [Polyangiaceae bacterium]